MRKAHRLAPIPAHDKQRFGVVVGVEQTDLSTDQLRMSVRGTGRMEVRHLLVDVRHRVGAVNAHLVGVPRVITGLAREVALGKDTMGALATDPAASQCLRGCLDVVRKLSPASLQRNFRQRVDWPGCLFEPAKPARHVCRGSANRRSRSMESWSIGWIKPCCATRASDPLIRS